jgi:hypothetical protein
MFPWLTPRTIAHVSLLLESYRRLVGKDLLPDSESLSEEERARRVFHAPFMVVSHGTEEDPIFNYGNQAALSLWEVTWDEFVHMPSRYSAEADHRDERARLLASVKSQGFATGYQGIRASKSGRRFRIEDTTVWNLTDDMGRYCGQAATYARYTYL